MRGTILSKLLVVMVGAFLVLIISVPFAHTQTQEILRIGYLTLGSGPAESEMGFKQQLSERGWLEGKNVAIEFRWAANDMERLPGLAAELVSSNVNVIVAVSTPVIQAVRNATTTIPIVMASAAAPVATGFVASLARPGGNITGLSLQSPELAGKRFELLKEIVPRLTRVAFMAHGDDLAHRLFIKEAQDVAPSIGITVHPVVIENAAEFDAAFAAMVRDRAGPWWSSQYSQAAR